MTHLNYLWWIYPLGCAALGALLAGGTREPEKNANPALPEGPPALDPSPVIPIDLSFGYLSAELKSPVKIPIPSLWLECKQRFGSDWILTTNRPT